jgi:predicted metal-dependent hydrolase
MTAASLTPADLSITSRDLHFSEAGGAERWWHGGDPVATAFYNALSVSFPLGERYFIDCVKRFRHLADERLQKQIEGFITQESIHTREHLAFNRIATERGYDLGRINAFLKRRFDWARTYGPRRQLASTAALEHFTAILAHELLSDPGDLEGAPDSIRRLWFWHAIEEIEHKGVAFDTFFVATKHLSGLRRWFLRCGAMCVATVLFLHEIAYCAGDFFRQDRIASFGTWWRFLRYVFVEPGVLRRVLGSYFLYFKPGFHPWHVDDRELIGKFEPILAQ